MNTNRSKWSGSLGWVVAAGLGVMMMGSGFQAAQEKTGVVDLNKVIQDSDLGKSNTQRLNGALKVRRDLIDWLTTYNIATGEQAEEYRRLMTKEPQTEADRTAMKKINDDVAASDKRKQDLLTKATLTDADRTLLADFQQRMRINEDRARAWENEFSGQLNQLREDLQSQTINMAKASLAEVAKTQGFTTVLESTVAPYGANDLTDRTITSLNSKRPR